MIRPRRAPSSCDARGCLVGRSAAGPTRWRGATSRSTTGRGRVAARCVVRRPSCRRSRAVNVRLVCRCCRDVVTVTRHALSDPVTVGVAAAVTAAVCLARWRLVIRRRQHGPPYKETHESVW